MKIGEGISGAIFSDDDHRFRYALWRIWDKSLDALLFIGLNPSRAGHVKDDPTVVRMVGFAKSWGYGGLFVGNLFSMVSTDPFVLVTDWSKEFYGDPNFAAIKRMRDLCSLVVVGWGEFGKRHSARVEYVMNLVGEPVHCIKMNQSGEPAHPLYLPGNSKLIRYYRRGAKCLIV